MIFADTGYLKALIYNKDKHHDDALSIKEFIEESNENTVINTTVLVETLNWSVKTNTFAKKIYKKLQSENEIITLTSKDYINSLEINSWFGNSINYSDCTILNTMMDLGITKIVTFDNDFKNIDGINMINGGW